MAWTGERSTEWRLKHSLQMRGRKFSKEHKIKIGLANKGRKRPDLSERNKRLWSELERQSHWNWKGGITLPNLAFRTTVRYKAWRKAVFTRDGWTCQDCNRKVKTIHAHHKKEFAKYPDLRLDVDNGITLCKLCHQKRHSH